MRDDAFWVICPTSVHCLDFVRRSMRERCLLLLDHLTIQSSVTHERRKGFYVNIPSTVKQALLGKHCYGDKIKWLKERGVIDENRPYSTGRKGMKPFPKSYRFCKAHRKQKVTLHRLETKPAIKSAVRKRKQDIANLDLVSRHFSQSFDRFSLDSLPQDFEEKLEQDGMGVWELGTLARWRNRHAFSVRCVYGRYHSLLTTRVCRIKHRAKAGSEQCKQGAVAHRRLKMRISLDFLSVNFLKEGSHIADHGLALRGRLLFPTLRAVGSFTEQYMWEYKCLK